MEGEDLVFILQVIDLGELSAEAAREAGAIGPQPDKIAVQPDNAVKLFILVPIARDGVAEPASFEEFLALEEHGDAWSSKDHGGGQRRTFLGVPARGIVRADFLRHALLAVRHLVVRFAIYNPVKSVIVIAVANGVAHG